MTGVVSDLCHWCEPTHVMAWNARTQKLDGPEAQGRIKLTGEIKCQCNDALKYLLYSQIGIYSKCHQKASSSKK